MPLSITKQKELQLLLSYTNRKVKQPQPFQIQKNKITIRKMYWTCRILNDAKSAIVNKKTVNLSYPIQNTDRTLGAIISNEISKIHGEDGLPEDTLSLNFKGSAGQSFGAFSTKGIT